KSPYGGILFEPHGSITFLDGLTIIATVPAAVVTSIQVSLGSTPRQLRAEYSGDENYLGTTSAYRTYVPFDVPISIADSWFLVSSSANGYSLEVQLVGTNGQPIQIEPLRPPLVSIVTSRGYPEPLQYQGSGRYTSTLKITRAL